jgi:tripartite-type tricarboxylate transporter receptor subunit TctC
MAADIADAVTVPDVAERYRSIGFESPRLSPDAFAQLIRRETVAWAANIREAQVRLD